MTSSKCLVQLHSEINLNIKSMSKVDIVVSKSAVTVCISSVQMVSMSAQNSFNFSFIQSGPLLLQLCSIYDTALGFIKTL